MFGLGIVKQWSGCYNPIAVMLRRVEFFTKGNVKRQQNQINHPRKRLVVREISIETEDVGILETLVFGSLADRVLVVLGVLRRDGTNGLDR